MKDTIHFEVLKFGLEYFKELINGEFKNIKRFVYFSGGTSLMFKYIDFPRFSVDLDFAVDIRGKKLDKLYYKLFAKLKENLEKICEEKEIPVYSSFGNWREFCFQGEYSVRILKIDFMYDWILDYENCCGLRKISDLDIFVNKLQRMNKTDLIDLKFLYKKNKFSLKEVIDGIQKKSQGLYGNPYYLSEKILQRLEKIKGFKFLNELKNELRLF